MRIVPVLDLKDGIVVHARRGERDRYAPLESPLVAGCDPTTVAEALLHATPGAPTTLYVADLDAIAGGPIDTATLQGLAELADVWVDAAATTPERAAQLEDAGVARNVIGTESLGCDPTRERERGRFSATSTEDRPRSRGPRPGPPAVLSVDLCDGRLLSPLPELAGRPPEAATELARRLNPAELIVIDLARVGAGLGPPLQAVAALAAALSETAVYAGGGVRDADDLQALQAAGAAGALVATALHEGRLTLG